MPYCLSHSYVFLAVTVIWWASVMSAESLEEVVQDDENVRKARSLMDNLWSSAMPPFSEASLKALLNSNSAVNLMQPDMLSTIFNTNKMLGSSGNGIIDAIFNSEATQALFRPENLNIILNSRTFRNLLGPPSIQHFLNSRVGKQLINPELISTLLNSNVVTSTITPDLVEKIIETVVGIGKPVKPQFVQPILKSKIWKTLSAAGSLRMLVCSDVFSRKRPDAYDQNSYAESENTDDPYQQANDESSSSKGTSEIDQPKYHKYSSIAQSGLDKLQSKYDEFSSAAKSGLDKLQSKYDEYSSTAKSGLDQQQSKYDKHPSILQSSLELSQPTIDPYVTAHSILDFFPHEASPHTTTTTDNKDLTAHILDLFHTHMPTKEYPTESYHATESVPYRTAASSDDFSTSSPDFKSTSEGKTDQGPTTISQTMKIISDESTTPESDSFISPQSIAILGESSPLTITASPTATKPVIGPPRLKSPVISGSTTIPMAKPLTQLLTSTMGSLRESIDGGHSVTTN